ncbi:MAG: hypothetical protein HOQ09_11270, partial [Gemmatimonadaceae bacterium]|nr:hypothetical protein [Gemmatimonadaceae bacterium]
MPGRPSPGAPALRVVSDVPAQRPKHPVFASLSIGAAWLVAAGALYALRHGPAMPAWVSLLAAATNAIALAVGWLASARRLPRRLYDTFIPSLLVASAPLFLLIELTGGLRSPAVLVPGFVALGVAWRGDLKRGAAVAGAWAAVLVLAGAALHHRTENAWLLSVVFTIFSLALIPVVYARQAVAAETKERQRLARGEGYLAERRLT